MTALAAEFVEEYRRRLSEVGGEAAAYVGARVARCGEAPVSEARDAAIEALSDAADVFGDKAQALACDLFDEVAEAEGVRARASLADGLVDPAWVERKVRYYAGALGRGDAALFRSKVEALASYHVRLSAWGCTAANCERAGLAWARVPTGRETCGWCFMLASRGFCYASERTAQGGSHPGCDCVAVPGLPGKTWVEGYDPEGMALRWGMCVDAVDNESLDRRARAAWDAMGAEGRWRYRAKLKPEVQAFLERMPQGERDLDSRAADEVAFGRFRAERLMKEAMREAERRDAGWLHDEVAPVPAMEAGARPLKKELDVGGILCENGFTVRFIREINKTCVKTPDAYLGTSVFEFKIPEGWSSPDGIHTMRKQFFKAKGKGTSHLLVSNAANGADAGEMERAAALALFSGDFPYIDEVIVVDAVTRKLIRIKK